MSQQLTIQSPLRLLAMPEIEREGILEQRLEEMQRFQDARNLDQMVKAQKGGETEGSKVPKRTYPTWTLKLSDLPARNTGSQAARGWNKEKTQKLDEYRAKRLAKGDKMKVRLRCLSDSHAADTFSAPGQDELPEARKVVLSYGYGNRIRRRRRWSNKQVRGTRGTRSPALRPAHASG